MELLDIRTMNVAIEAELNRRLADAEITYIQGTLLGLLQRAGDQEVAQVDLEAWLGLSRPTVNSILRRLTEKRLVSIVRSARDRRRHRVQITAAGCEQATHMSVVVQQMEEQAFAAFSDAEVDAFAGFVQRFTENVRGAPSGTQAAS